MAVRRREKGKDHTARSRIMNLASPPPSFSKKFMSWRNSLEASPCLLLGNGINRLTGGDSWEALLEALAKGVGLDIRDLKAVPFPLLFEIILSHRKVASRAPYAEEKIKKVIVDRLHYATPSAWHRKALEAEYSDILTTNYDLCLERAISGPRAPLDPPSPFTVIEVPERRYSVYRGVVFQQGSSPLRRLWYVHGDIRRPNTICLGTDHYAGNIQKARGIIYITDPKNANKRSINAAIRESMDPRITHPHTWLSQFLASPLVVLGLTLDFSEAYLWWLLVTRARIMGRGSMMRICYLCNKKHAVDPTLLKALTGLGIVVLEATHVEEMYETAFEKQ